jgi:hypothetical protein
MKDEDAYMQYADYIKMGLKETGSEARTWL